MRASIESDNYAYDNVGSDERVKTLICSVFVLVLYLFSFFYN